jgi:hypothetical protein
LAGRDRFADFAVVRVERFERVLVFEVGMDSEETCGEN